MKGAALKGAVRWIALGALLALVSGLGTAWWLHTFERVEKTIDLPPRGEASYNPLYALKLALHADGVAVQSRQRLDLAHATLGKHDTVLVFNDPRTLSLDDIDTLLGWVEDGGHLLVRTPPAGLGAGMQRPDQLLPQLDLRVLPGNTECARLAAGPVPASSTRADRLELAPYLFCGGARFVMDGIEPLHDWGDLKSGYVYARLAHGAGTIDVLADFSFLSNTGLENKSQLALTRQLLAPGWKQGTVHLVYAASMPPLWKLLLDRAWMAWLPLLLALAAWLWMRSQRLGPQVPAPEPDRRALLEHVQASGEHDWRYGRAPILFEALRVAFLDRLRRRDPLAAALDGKLQFEAIAARTGASVDEVAHALQTPRPNDAADFRQRVARLLQLRQKL